MDELAGGDLVRIKLLSSPESSNFLPMSGSRDPRRVRVIGNCSGAHRPEEPVLDAPGETTGAPTPLRPAGLLDHVLEALAWSLGHELEERPAGRLQRFTDAAKRGVLIAHPVERIERDDEIELAAKGQGRGVAYREGEVRILGFGKVCLGKVDHVGRGIDAEDRSAPEAPRDLRGDPAVAAADVQDPLGPSSSSIARSASHLCREFRSLYPLASFGHGRPSRANRPAAFT